MLCGKPWIVADTCGRDVCQLSTTVVRRSPGLSKRVGASPCAGGGARPTSTHAMPDRHRLLATQSHRHSAPVLPRTHSGHWPDRGRGNEKLYAAKFSAVVDGAIASLHDYVPSPHERKRLERLISRLLEADETLWLTPTKQASPCVRHRAEQALTPPIHAHPTKRRVSFMHETPGDSEVEATQFDEVEPTVHEPDDEVGATQEAEEVGATQVSDADEEQWACGQARRSARRESVQSGASATQVDYGGGQPRSPSPSPSPSRAPSPSPSPSPFPSQSAAPSAGSELDDGSPILFAQPRYTATTDGSDAESGESASLDTVTKRVLAMGQRFDEKMISRVLGAKERSSAMPGRREGSTESTWADLGPAPYTPGKTPVLSPGSGSRAASVGDSYFDIPGTMDACPLGEGRSTTAQASALSPTLEWSSMCRSAPYRTLLYGNVSGESTTKPPRAAAEVDADAGVCVSAEPSPTQATPVATPGNKYTTPVRRSRRISGAEAPRPTATPTPTPRTRGRSDRRTPTARQRPSVGSVVDWEEYDEVLPRDLKAEVEFTALEVMRALSALA